MCSTRFLLSFSAWGFNVWCTIAHVSFFTSCHGIFLFVEDSEMQYRFRSFNPVSLDGRDSRPFFCQEPPNGRKKAVKRLDIFLNPVIFCSLNEIPDSFFTKQGHFYIPVRTAFPQMWINKSPAPERNTIAAEKAKERSRWNSPHTAQPP